MKSFLEILPKISVLVLLFFLVSCASTQESQQETEQHIIDMGKFNLASPQGKSWRVTVEKEKEEVTFEGDRTTLRVFRKALPEGKWQASEEEIAKDLFDIFENLIKQKRVEVQFIKRDVMMYNGKKLYITHLRALAGGDIVFRSVGYEAMHFVYFQPDLSTTHEAYTISISKIYPRGPISRDRGGLKEREIDVAYRLIDSLQFR